MRRVSKMVWLVLGWAMTSALAQASVFNEELRARYPASQRLEFSAGENPVVALQQPAQVALPRGVAIVLLDTYAHGLTLPVARQLAERLSRWGWHVTLLPVEIVAGSDAGPANLLPDSRYTDNTQPGLSHTAWNNEVLLRLNGALNALSEQPGYRIIIGQGMNGAALLNLDAQQILPATDSLITIAPFWPENTLNAAVASHLKDSQTPVLDISGGGYNRWSEQTTAQRERIARVNLKLHYRQTQLHETTGTALHDPDFVSPFVSQVSKTIYGWVDYLGW
ncbi:DUF3530 family protein [Salinimonas marina]|uniref:DUF3530 family protein n=1 Tax=Salinimonas marina TaxID=2785918 RepID=A0A7S9DWV7_9ALTE|nr:DUF3530 family protein [Salinimonas marina]QPG05312.1 DUF3530 family protein [Salinimonas marina]